MRVDCPLHLEGSVLIVSSAPAPFKRCQSQFVLPPEAPSTQTSFSLFELRNQSWAFSCISLHPGFLSNP